MFNRVFGSIILISFVLHTQFACANTVVLNKNEIEKPKLETGNVDKTIKGTLLLDDSEELANLIDDQKKHDLKDLERL